MLRYGVYCRNSLQICSKTNTIFAYMKIESVIKVKMVQKRALPFKIPKTTSASLILQEDKESYFYDNLHQHEEYQLTLVIEGSGTVVHGEYVGTFQSGDVFLMGSNVPHVFRCDDSYYKEDKEAHSISVFFNEEQLRSLINQFPEFGIMGTFLDSAKLGARGDDLLQREIGEKIKSLFQMDEFERLIEFFSLLNQLSCHSGWQPLLKQYAKRVREQDGKRLDDIFSFTLSHYHRPITIDEIADVANMNRTSFCRYFKQHTRKSYIDFLNEYRVQKACGLFSDPDNSIAQVAFEVGFTNLSNFNRQFKKLMNQTPREYRTKLMANYN